MLQTGFYYDSEEEEYYEEDEEYYQECSTESAKSKMNDEEKQMARAKTPNSVEENDHEEYTADIFDFAPSLMITNKGKKFKNVATDSELFADNITQEEPNDKKYARFRGADKIYHRILWDEKFKKQDFIIGYEDRFEGIMEETFDVFETLKEDIPFHRIRFFKQNGIIVWERKTKTNKL